MRILFLLLLSVLTSSCAQKQSNYKGFDAATHNSQIKSLEGKWKINMLIANSETKEYILRKQSPDRFDNYGFNISLNTDQTFVSDYSAECGNDCFTTTKGKYKIINENYICFYLQDIERNGDCSGNEQPNKDLGLYYYYKEENGFHLLKSSGTLEQDQKNRHYRDLIVAKSEEIAEFDKKRPNPFMFNWKATQIKDENQLVAFCMAENQIDDYEVLYSYKVSTTRNVILVKIDHRLRYVVYDTWGEPKVCLYNDSKIEEINEFVKKVDGDKSLNIEVKKTTIAIVAPSENKTITVFKKKQEIAKVLFAMNYKMGDKMVAYTCAIYFQNAIPVYLDYQLSTESNNQVSRTGLYVFDWQNNKDATITIQQDLGKIEKQLYYEKPVVDKIMEEVTPNN